MDDEDLEAMEGTREVIEEGLEDGVVVEGGIVGLLGVGSGVWLGGLVRLLFDVDRVDYAGQKLRKKLMMRKVRGMNTRWR